MMRYIYISAIFAVSPCFASEGVYTYDSLPMPEINYLKTPYVQIRDMNSVVKFDGSASYNPDGGKITEWMWNFYKFNGKSWDFLFTLSGPDKAVINCRITKIGLYKVRLWVRANHGSETDSWNQPNDVKECFVYVIYHKISANQYVAVGSAMTFTYIIKLPKGIQAQACLTMLDEYGMEIAEIRIKNPVIGKEAKIEWDGRANKGPNAGEFIPAGRFRVNFRVIPFHIIPKKPISQEDLKNVT